MSRQRRGAGEGAIFQRPDGRWEARLDLGWSPSGRRRKSVYGKTRKEVVDKLRAAQNLHDHEQVIADERLTVERWLTHWSANILGNRVANGTITQTTADHYDDVVRLHLIPALGPIKLTKLTPEHVDAFLMAKATKGYRPNTRRIFRGTLRKALRDAERAGHVVRNVATLSEPIRLDRRAAGWLMLPEAQRLLHTARGDRLEAAVVVGLSLGLRRSELLALRWSSFDFDRKTVLITHALTRVRNTPDRPGYDATFGRTRLQLGEPKTKTSTRLQFVPAPALDALRSHRRRQAAERLAARDWPGGDLVFTTPVGTFVDPANFAKTISRLCITAGLGHRNPHQLRH